MRWVPVFAGISSVPLGGICPGVRPTIKLTYLPPPGNSLTVDNIRDFCPPDVQCPVPEEILESMNPETTFPIIDFTAHQFTAVQSGGDLRSEQPVFTRDKAGLVPSLGKTNGTIVRPIPPNPFTLLGYDFFVNILPMQAETFTMASNKNLRGIYDNVHLKEEITNGIYFPNCNDPRPTRVDLNPCLHLHENWFGTVPAPNQTYSREQTVWWYVVRLRPGPEESPDHPRSIVDGEPLFNSAHLGFDLVLWVQSRASSKECDAPGGTVVNLRRPCVVFPNAVFPSPR